MKNLYHIMGGLLSAVLSGLLVIGGLSVSLAEGSVHPTPTLTNTPSEFQVSPIIIPIDKTPQPTSTSSNTPTFIPSTACPLPEGWAFYTIQADDTTTKLAERYHITADQLLQANCLTTSQLIQGTILYVPGTEPDPTSSQIIDTTPTSYSPSCGAPLGWVSYTVRSNDTLFHLSTVYGVSVPELQFANCMGTSTLLVTGTHIYVPNTPTRTPQVQDTQEPTQGSGGEATLTPTQNTPTDTETPIISNESTTPNPYQESTSTPTPTPPIPSTIPTSPQLTQTATPTSDGL